MNGSVHDQRIPEQLRIVLISDDDALDRIVGDCCPPPHELVRFPLSGLVGASGIDSGRLQEIMAQAPEAHVFLIEWDISHAPLVGIVGRHVRMVPPPLIAVCKNGAEDQAAALVVGADDVVNLPISVPLLRAKILAHLRSLQSVRSTDDGDGGRPRRRAEPLRVGNLGVDHSGHRFTIGDAQIRLTPRQFDLVSYFVQNADMLVTRDQILDHVWGIGFDIGTNMIDVYVHFVRRLLRANEADVVIETVRGKGYRLTVGSS